MAENCLSEKVIGVALDGTGFGADGAIWGGEFLLVSPGEYLRVGHLKYQSMPGGEQAIRDPWRMAFSYLYTLAGTRNRIDSMPELFRRNKTRKDYLLLKQMLDKGINSPLTSSCGRLFDAVASLIGLREEIDFEGQAAMELEALCQPEYEENYRYQIIKEENNWIIDTGRMFQQIILDLEKKVSLNKIATQFHNTVADFILSLCVKIRKDYNINYVALSGGVFQNSFLLAKTIKKLKAEEFKVIIHKKLPPNDACISLGQALVADSQIEREN
jgi:hydrogenase maturation protein HypF